MPKKKIKEINTDVSESTESTIIKLPKANISEIDFDNDDIRYLATQLVNCNNPDGFLKKIYHLWHIPVMPDRYWENKIKLDITDYLNDEKLAEIMEYEEYLKYVDMDKIEKINKLIKINDMINSNTDNPEGLTSEAVINLVLN